MFLLKPDQSYERVEDISAAALRAMGVSALLLDIDNTLVSRASGTMPSSVNAWVAHLKASGLALCLISNNWHRSVFDYAAELKLPLVHKAMKPLPFAYLRALGKIAAQRKQAAVIGDQLFTDVLGAHLLGIRALLVQPRSEADLWYTKIFRRLEKRLGR
ncbi:MAG: YqeG family HAD IIIA-type phosphatase [Coriobacteriales bacterium]|jgi:HAD superfamily phosphatase (TIGR01668 family)|nr:YqeG family HAD IIIA-type phosphatase [Coriobacteriales bacterium]